MLTDKEINTLE